MVQMHSLAIQHNGATAMVMVRVTILRQRPMVTLAIPHSEPPIRTDLDALILIVMAIQTPTQQESMALYGPLQMVRMRSQARRANGPTRMVMAMATMQVALMLTIVLQRLEHRPNLVI